MNLRKKAFTIVEILVVFVFIGVIVVAELLVLKGRINQYSSSYYTTFEAIRKTSYNIMADIDCYNGAKTDNPECNKGPRSYPTTSEELCERMKEFINAAPESEKAGRCSYEDIDDAASNFKDEDKTLRFTASNGNRFYISRMYEKEIPTRENINIKTKYQYFIVYVDKNGKNKPNKVTMRAGERNEIYPDIVPFIVTRRGEAIPAGIPAYSRLYMTAKIIYPDIIDGNGNIVADRFSESMTFNEAIHRAWGGVVDPTLPYSLPFSEYMSEKNNKATSFFINTSLVTNPPGLDDESVTANDGFAAGCDSENYTCSISIDSNIETRY